MFFVTFDKNTLRFLTENDKEKTVFCNATRKRTEKIKRKRQNHQKKDIGFVQLSKKKHADV